jgi:hypothetical protein
MGLLAAALYDPGTAVTKATTAGLAMTALDTTNLRLTFTVPASGRVMVQMAGVTHGGNATPWHPQILFGVLQGTTVIARVPASGHAQGSVQAITTFLNVQGQFTVPNLTPSASLTWDAAYGVETIAPGSAIKYGGPNDGTVNTAFGGFRYEVWDVT